MYTVHNIRRGEEVTLVTGPVSNSNLEFIGKSQLVHEA